MSMTFDDVDSTGPVPMNDEPMHDPDTSAGGTETADATTETENAEG